MTEQEYENAYVDEIIRAIEAQYKTEPETLKNIYREVLLATLETGYYEQWHRQNPDYSDLANSRARQARNIFINGRMSDYLREMFRSDIIREEHDD